MICRSGGKKRITGSKFEAALIGKNLKSFELVVYIWGLFFTMELLQGAYRIQGIDLLALVTLRALLFPAVFLFACWLLLRVAED